MLERLRCLDATERRVLDLIAVCGGAVPHDILHTVTGQDEESPENHATSPRHRVRGRRSE